MNKNILCVGYNIKTVINKYLKWWNSAVVVSLKVRVFFSLDKGLWTLSIVKIVCNIKG